MRLLRMIEHISLDGIIQVSSEPGDDFPYADWTAPYRTPAGRDMVLAAHGSACDLLLGRRTYDAWSGYWPTAPASPIADLLNGGTKYVVTHRNEGLSWGPAEQVGPDLISGVQRLKQQDGPTIVLSGSCSLTSPLIAAGLVDELVTIVYPVLLGTGKRLFSGQQGAHAFELVHTQTTPTGIVFSSYRAAAALTPRALA